MLYSVLRFYSFVKDKIEVLRDCGIGIQVYIFSFI